MEEIFVCAAGPSSSPLCLPTWRPPLRNRKCCCGRTGRSSPRPTCARAAPLSPSPDSARRAPGIRPPCPPRSSARWWRRASTPTRTSGRTCAPRRASATPSDSTSPTRPCRPTAPSTNRGGSAPSSSCPRSIGARRSGWVSTASTSAPTSGSTASRSPLRINSPAPGVFLNSTSPPPPNPAAPTRSPSRSSRPSPATSPSPSSIGTRCRRTRAWDSGATSRSPPRGPSPYAIPW